MVAAIKSVAWPRSNRNRWPRCVGICNLFEAQIAKLPARGPTADAIRYALNHWDGLQRFLEEDGRIELDNNSVERAMRPVCLSRKNRLFAGSDVGASYCPSGDVLIKSADFAEDREISGVSTAAPQRHGARRPSAGQQAELSRARRRIVAARESRHWSPFGRLSLGSPSEFRRLRRS